MSVRVRVGAAQNVCGRRPEAMRYRELRIRRSHIVGRGRRRVDVLVPGGVAAGMCS